MPSEFDPIGRYLNRFGPGSVRSMHHALGVLAELLGAPGRDPRGVAWTELTVESCARLRRKLIYRYARATAHRVLLVLRGVLREVALAGHGDPEVARSIEGVHRPRRPLSPRKAGLADLIRLFDNCRDDETIAGCRDAAALALVCGAGLHRATAVALDRASYDANGYLLVPGSSRRFASRVRLSASIRKALDAWLHLRGDEPGPLLCPVNKADRVQLRRMTDQALYLIIVRRTAQAGVRLSPADLRRGYLVRRRRLAQAGDDAPALEVPFVGCGPRCAIKNP